MSKTITIDPITRLEGHLAIRAEYEAGRVVKAYSSGEMFRGFETILRGRDPLDAQQFTQRICGVCPIAHGFASILAQDQAYGIAPPENGRLMRNLIQGANYIQSHIIHFYQLSALDFVDIAAIVDYTGKDSKLVGLKEWVKHQQASKVAYPAAPFLPRYEGKYILDAELNIAALRHYLDGLEMRQTAHQAAAIFCGKMPHATALVPGGVTEKVTAVKIGAYKSRLKRLQTFIEESYLPDVLEVAKSFPDYFSVGRGCGNFLAYGVFPESDRSEDRFLPSGVLLNGKLQSFDPGNIVEDVQYSLFSSATGLPPNQGETVPDPEKTGAYSWLKAPRYQGNVMEVGPLARILVAYHKGTKTDLKKLVDDALALIQRPWQDLISVMGRHAVRAIECKMVADRCLEWLEQLVPGKPGFQDFTIPDKAEGVGLHEAPRGALGHWLQIENRKISRYQCVVPSTWNCSPRDDRNIPGPIEQALEGTMVENSDHPIELMRIIRSFDPCLACAVH